MAKEVRNAERDVTPMAAQLPPEIRPFYDEEGMLISWPARHAKKQLVCERLARLFEPGRDYSEHEVNAILSGAHRFSDFFLLRRELIERGLLRRERDGSRYWREHTETEKENS